MTTNWKRINISELEKYRSEYDFFSTWQIYEDDIFGENGLEWGNLCFDFDSEANISYALADTIKLYKYLLRVGVNDKNIKLFFSGNKGFHFATVIS